MLKLKAIVAALSVAALAGCQTAPPQQMPLAPQADADVTAKLAQTAVQASESMQRLAQMRVNGRSMQPTDTPAIPPGLEVPVSIEWVGPLNGLVEKIAGMTGYKFSGELGNRPAIPVVVSVKQVDRTAWFLIENADSQAHPAANIIVRPDSRELLVQYPPTIRSGGYPLVSAK